MKYLGALLISSKLRAEECNQLKENLVDRIQRWANKLLTNGGSIQAYWRSLFVPPQKTLKGDRKFVEIFSLKYGAA